MPYKYGGKNYRKKGKGSSTPWYARKYSAQQLASKAWQAAKYVKSLVNVERKFFDVDQVNQPIGSTAAVYPLTNIAGGDDYKTRDGNSIKTTSILMRLSAVLNASAEQTFVRYILLIDNEARNAAPAGTDVLEANQYLSALNHVNGKRFTVIRDKMLNLRKDMNAMAVKEYAKCSHHIKFSSATNTDVREGSMYLLLISDQPTNTPLVDFSTRLRYVDN